MPPMSSRARRALAAVLALAAGAGGCRLVLGIEDKELVASEDAAVVVPGSDAGAEAAATEDAGDDATAGDGGCPSGRTRCAAGCVDLATDTTNCGYCGHACKGSCNTSRCVAKVAWDLGAHPSQLVQSGATLFIASDASGGRVRRLLGVDNAMLASGVGSNARLALSEPYLYWVAPATGKISRVGTDTSGLVDLATGEPGTGVLATDGASLFFTRTGVSGTVQKMDAAGGASATIANVASPSALAVDATHVFFSGTASPDVGVWRTDKAGGGRFKIHPGPASTIVLSGDHAFVYDVDKSSIVRVAKSGTEAALTLVSQTAIAGMDVDATHVWYTLPAGEVYRVSRDGGAKEPVAVAQETPTEIVAGATDAVFWIAATRIYTAPK